MTATNDIARARATANFYRAAGAGPRLDFNTVRAAAAGRWPAILTACGLDAAHLTGRHAACPGCGGRDRFRFDDRDGAGTWLCSAGGGAPLAGDGFALLAHVHGWSASEALHRVADALGLRDGRELPPIQQRRPAPAAQPDPAAVDRTRGRLNALWREAVPLDHGDAEPARRYLAAARGLGDLIARADLPADVRLHPCAPYWHTGDDGRPVRIAEAPTLFGLVRGPSGEPVGLHSTYLRSDGSGKAALVDGAGNALKPRKLRLLHRGAGHGAAVRLYPPGERLALGEGLETVLACRCADPTLPVWSCLSAGALATAELPECVRDVLLIADRDPAGARAVLALAGRLRREGRTVRVLVPPTVATEGC